MKIFLILIILTLIGCASERTEISGNFVNSNEEMVLLNALGVNILQTDTAQFDTNGRFSFKQKINTPTFYSLSVGNQSITLLAHPGEKINITADAKQMSKTYAVTGSRDSHSINLLHKQLEQTSHLRDSLVKALRMFENSRNYRNIQLQFDLIYQNAVDSLRSYNINFIEQNPQSLAVIYALYQQLDHSQMLFNREEDFRYFRAADSVFYRRYPKIPYVNMLRANVVELNQSYNTLQWNRMISMLGQEAPEIALTAPDGKVVKLSDKREKYVLLDFWASWCAVCRSDNANLLEIYEKYNLKGFEIYQVSLDSSKALWEQAIAEDSLPWTNVCDFRYWNSEVVELYQIETIPSNFLIDREGSIITKNITSERLDKTLNELLAAH
jgi:peroxiredoxin